MPPRLLLVEDETPLVALLRYNLEKEGFDIQVADDGEEAILLIDENPPDLVVLDWMLPHLSGLDVCRRIRAKSTTRNLPIVMLTARGEEADRVRGLEVGADDFVVKPFSPNELIARIRAVLRRAKPATVGLTLQHGGLTLDTERFRVTIDGNPVHLGPKEFALLRTLMEQPGRVFSRGHLLDAVWGHGVYVEERTVDVHIGRLRKALRAASKTDPIRTVRSGGYALDDTMA